MAKSLLKVDATDHDGIKGYTITIDTRHTGRFVNPSKIMEGLGLPLGPSRARKNTLTKTRGAKKKT